MRREIAVTLVALLLNAACSDPPNAVPGDAGVRDAGSPDALGACAVLCAGLQPGPCELAPVCDGARCWLPARPDGSACDDGDACTAPDQCIEGACEGVPAVVCEPIDDCHGAGTCDPATGACSTPARPDGAACSDGDVCTLVDSCDSGLCVGGAPAVCEPVNGCHEAVGCDAFEGCLFAQRDDGATCDDGSVCTATDACEAGTCVGGDVIEPPGAACDDGVCFTDLLPGSGITWEADGADTNLIGAGVALLDYDGDGALDILLGAEGGSPALYRNLGGGAFADVTAAAGIPSFTKMQRVVGFAVADYDADGDPDVYLYYRGPNLLLRNDGGVFVDVAAAAGVADPSWSAAAAWGDYDRDGLLDLYVGNYIAATSFPLHTPHPNTLYKNNGDGTFTDVTAAAGVAGAGTTLAVTWSDYDGDGRPDLWVCNDFGMFIEPNRLYRNTPGGFVDVSEEVGAAAQLYCMGIAPGDYDGDGDLDYYFSNIGRNLLLRNDGAAGFTDVTAATATELTYDRCFTERYTTSWAVAFEDFDDDGALDLYVANGHIPADPSIANARASANALLRGDGTGGAFTDISHTAAVDDERLARGVALGDLDNDGDVDLVQVNADGAPLVLRNDSPGGAALHLRLVGTASNRDGLGARVRATIAGTTHHRELAAHRGYAATWEPAVHIGLGPAAMVDTLVIDWPSGVTQTLTNVPPGRLTVVEP